MLNTKDTIMLVIDIQPKLLKAVKDKMLPDYAKKLVKSANLLDIPVLVTEQYPQGLGDTIPELETIFSPDTKIVPKTAFNALKEEGFFELFKSYSRRQVVIFGIEAHICVYQTAADLVRRGFDVWFVKDASASRSEYEFVSGIDLMKQSGIKVASFEAVLFSLLGDSGHPHFKEIQSFVK